MKRAKAMTTDASTIDGWISDAATRDPDKPALIFDRERLSYGDMAKAVSQRADDLRSGGIRRGDRIAWYGLNHPEVFVLLFACARIGAMLVPLNWRLAAPEIATIVANCEPKLLFHDDHFAEEAKSITGPAILPIGADVPPRNGNAGAEPPTIDDPILLVYTSGSTGTPKGAVLTQRALACNAAMSVEAHGMNADDMGLVVLPLFHVGGLNILPTPAFSVGATIVLHERFDPAATCAALEEVTLAIMVPTVLQAVMATEGWDGADLSALRAMSIGSTDVPRALIEAIHSRGVPLIQVYGATETAPFAIYQTVDDAMDTVGSIGRAGSRNSIRLVDGLRDVAVGEPGEILVKGDNVLSEYWREPGQTAASLVDGWFHTGDVATLDEHGQYWFTDRIKHIIISGGENIYPTEIERVLRDLPGIIEVAVVGRSDPKWGEIPVAVVVSDGNVTNETVLAACDGRLARYKHPKAVVFVDALPRNATGKVVAAQVREMIANP